VALIDFSSGHPHHRTESRIQQIVPSTLKPAIPGLPVVEWVLFPDAPLFSEHIFVRGESKEIAKSKPVKFFAKRSGTMSESMKAMQTARRISQSFCIGLLLLACTALSGQNPQQRIRNIVLVHGAWADGSGWKGVYDILVKDGYNVSLVQEPETTFADDVAATRRVLAQQDGPCILVAHSYGGAVITEAGTDSSVAGLVYIAAHMPDAGENEADDGKRFPSDLSKSSALKKTADGFTYLDPAQFHEYFAADVPAEQASFMAHSQVFNFADNFKGVITTAAWRSKPSWMLVAGADRTINPDLERWYATRANSHKVEVPGASHAVYVSRPKEVAALIEQAASQAK
jgi:pimeloyl-ACP methyl ester carboxylesterase